jgi:hypothetical protein
MSFISTSSREAGTLPEGLHLIAGHSGYGLRFFTDETIPKLKDLTI